MKLVINSQYEQYCSLEVKDLIRTFGNNFFLLKEKLDLTVDFLLDEDTFTITPLYHPDIEIILKKYSITIEELRNKLRIDTLMMCDFLDSLPKITTQSNKVIWFYYENFYTCQNAEGIVQLRHSAREEDSEFDGIWTNYKDPLSFNKNRVLIKKHISYKTKEEKDYIRVLVTTSRYLYDSKTGFLFHHLYKKKTVATYFWKDSYNITKFVGKRREYTFNFIDADLFELAVNYVSIKEPKYAETLKKLKGNYTATAKFLKSPMWKDLNSSLIGEMDKNTAARLRYHYKKYGTKKLRELFFQTKNKKIQQFITDNSKDYLLGFSVMLKKYIKDDNYILSILTKFSKERGYGLTSSSNTYPKNLAVQESAIKFLIEELNFTPRKILNLKMDLRTVDDVSRMYSEIKTYNQNYIFPDLENIERAHDFLSRDLREYRHKKINRTITLTDLEEAYKKELDNYIIEPISETNELTRIGTTMNICVGSYDSRAYNKDCTIVGLYSKENKDPIVCIEVRKNKIIQAKLKRNNRVSSDPILKEYVINWAQENRLEFDTSDIDENNRASIW